MTGSQTGLRFAFVLCLLALAGSMAAAQQWTRFRGPNGQGQSRFPVPGHLDREGRALEGALPGAGHSSPVLWGDRVFSPAHADADAAGWLCLDADTGKKIWKTRSTRSKAFHVHVQNGFATSTPVVDKPTWWFASGRRRTIICRRGLRSQGKENWQEPRAVRERARLWLADA